MERLIPGKEEEILFRTVALNDALPQDNGLAFAQIEAELRNLLEKTERVLDESAAMLSAPGKSAFSRLIKRESLNDYLDERIGKAILELSLRKLGQKEMSRAVLVVRMSNALEQLADFGAAVGYVANAMEYQNQKISEEALGEIQDLHVRLRDDIRLVRRNFPLVSEEDVVSMRQNEISMRERINMAYSRHLGRFYKGKAYSGNAFVKAMSRMDSAHAKLREVRKLCEMYAKL